MSYLHRNFLMLTIVTTAACSSAPDPTSSVASSITDDGENNDIQLITAEASGNFSRNFLWENCNIFDKTSTGTNQFEARADCTDAAARSLSIPLFNRYVEPLLWIYENSSSASYTSRHWCSEAILSVAVKESALNSPNFQKIGFYTYNPSMGDGTEGTFVSYDKTDWRLAPRGEGRLKSGEKVIFFSFAGVGPCEVNGSGQNPGGRLEVKPYVTYEGGLRRWEAVSRNHGIGYGGRNRIDRTGDLLDLSIRPPS